MGNKQISLPKRVVDGVTGAISGPVDNKKHEDVLTLRACLADEALLRSVGETLPDGCNAVHKACEKNRVDLVEILLTKTDKYTPPPAPQFLDAQKAGGATPLHIAALRGYDEVAECLLRFGADVDARNENNQTPYDFCQHNLDLSNDPNGVRRRRGEAKDRIASLLKQKMKQVEQSA